MEQCLQLGYSTSEAQADTQLEHQDTVSHMAQKKGEKKERKERKKEKRKARRKQKKKTQSNNKKSKTRKI